MKKQFIAMVLFAIFTISAKDGFCQDYLMHKVEYGETVYSIPVHYNSTTLEFLAINGFEINVDLKPGMMVKIRPYKEFEIQNITKPAEKPVMASATSKKDEMMLATKLAVEKPDFSKSEVANAEPVKTAPAKKEVAEPVAVVVADYSNKSGAPTTSAYNFIYDANKTTDMGPNGILYKISKNGYHVVEKKQTMYHIALIYNTTIENLLKINKLQSTNILIGQKLKVQG